MTYSPGELVNTNFKCLHFIWIAKRVRLGWKDKIVEGKTELYVKSD